MKIREKAIFLLIVLIPMLMSNCSNKKNNYSKKNIFFESININLGINPHIQLINTIQIGEDVFIGIKTSSSPKIYILKFNGIVLTVYDSIYLPKDYLFSEKYGFLESFTFINLDSIVFFQDNRISIFNPKINKVIFELNHSIDDSNNKIFLQAYSQNIFYNRINNSIVTDLVRLDNLKSKKHDADTEFSSEFSINKKKIRILKGKYTSDFLSELRFSPNAMMYITTDGKYYYAASGIGNKILKWAINNNSKVNEYEVKSRFFTKPIYFSRDILSRKDILVRNLELSFRYTNLIFDKNTNLLYRFFEKQMDDYNKNGFKNNSKEKEIGLNIISTDFKINEDLIICKKYDILDETKFFISKYGIIFINKISEDNIKIGVIKIENTTENEYK